MAEVGIEERVRRCQQHRARSVGSWCREHGGWRRRRVVEPALQRARHARTERARACVRALSADGPSGNVDTQHGITQITVGTGGEDLDTLARTSPTTFSNPNVVTGQDQAFGVMKLSLNPDSFSWDYKPALAGPLATDPTAAMSYSDSGSSKCRG